MFSAVPSAAATAAAAAAMMPWSFNPETICESAARLLFMNVRWAKSVPAFTTLPSRDQIILLEESWRELFVLGAAQFTLPIEAGTLMTALGLSTNSSSPGSSPFGISSPVSSERQLGLLSEIKTFQETVAKFKQMNVDATEYACLRAVILFKTCKNHLHNFFLSNQPIPFHFTNCITKVFFFFFFNSCRTSRYSIRCQFARPGPADTQPLRVDCLSEPTVALRSPSPSVARTSSHRCLHNRRALFP